MRKIKFITKPQFKKKYKDFNLGNNTFSNNSFDSESINKNLKNSEIR